MSRTNLKSFPKISFVIPVLNEEKRITECLLSIVSQDYPSEKTEILIADAGSKDNTVNIAKKYGAVILHNKLKTSEAGKALGVKKAQGELICFVDGDNILTGTDWLKKMTKPLIEDPEIIGSEALYFTYRKEDGFIDRYCAMLGMNDPLCLWLGSYDRMSVLSKTWTGLKVKTKNKDGYKLIYLESGNIPTIGANGSLFRREVLMADSKYSSKYLFDTDILERFVSNNGVQKFAKVDVGIVHLYCGSSLKKFGKKQLRRVRDYLYRRNVTQIFVKNEFGDRVYKYGHANSLSFSFAILKFCLSCVFVIPLFYQVLVGYSRKKDLAWFAHPLLCWITLVTYALGGMQSVFNPSELSRENW